MCDSWWFGLQILLARPNLIPDMLNSLPSICPVFVLNHILFTGFIPWQIIFCWVSLYFLYCCDNVFYICLLFSNSSFTNFVIVSLELDGCLNLVYFHWHFILESPHWHFMIKWDPSASLVNQKHICIFWDAFAFWVNISCLDLCDFCVFVEFSVHCKPTCLHGFS